jgi:hypothetical protein
MVIGFVAAVLVVGTACSSSKESSADAAVAPMDAAADFPPIYYDADPVGGGDEADAHQGDPACRGMNYPVSCPARNGAPASCWSAGTICSTVALCNGKLRSCTSSSRHYDCVAMRCVRNDVDGGAD